MRALYPGCVAPVKTTVTVSTDDADFDLSTATAGRIVAQFADGTGTSWTATLSGASADELVLTREHEADDVPAGTEGIAYIHGEVDIPASAAPLKTTSSPIHIARIGA